MVKIRLMRMGSMKNPHYRVVVVDGRTKRGGDYIEQIGYYDPRETTNDNLKIDTDRAAHWLGNGAQPTDTVVRLFQKTGVAVPGSAQATKRASFKKRQEAQAKA